VHVFVQMAARKNTELHNVNANIKRKLKALSEKKKSVAETAAADSNLGRES